MLRYIVERIADGEFLELDLPITVSGAGRKLNGAGSFSGTLEPDVGGLRQADGTLLIDPYATFIHEEADDVIRGTWLVTRSELDGDTWSIEGAGFSSYFANRPYEGEYKGVRVDPVAIARHVVQHAQSFANADIGVTVRGSSSVRVGSDSEAKADAAQFSVNSAKTALDQAKKALTSARAAAKANPTTENKNLVNTRKAQVDSLTATKKRLDEELAAAKKVVQDDGGAWSLLWWDTPDCLGAIQDALDEAGCEWVEWSGWNEDHTKILKEIRVSSRVGVKQDKLAFIEGDNVIEAVPIESDAGEYANVVKAIGAGEGRDSLSYTTPTKSTRRRKVYVLDAKHVTKRSVLVNLANAELARRERPMRIAAIRVIDHPLAEFGTFSVGDTVLVDADSGWAGRQRLWQRIEELEWVGEDVIDLMLGDA